MADDDAGARMRRRQFASEVERLKSRQSGLTPRHQSILEGVYELEPRPDWRTEARLASQLGLDSVAVTCWQGFHLSSFFQSVPSLYSILNSSSNTHARLRCLLLRVTFFTCPITYPMLRHFVLP